jgi:Heterokaryon incompatibility protein Het-C
MLSGFMSFGYATREFEVTEERLGVCSESNQEIGKTDHKQVYRPEEHLDNPVGYRQLLRRFWLIYNTNNGSSQ